MLSIKSLVHAYSHETRISYPDWEVKKGNHALILGNSGSGKTTLLHLIGALLRPTSGEVWIDQQHVSSMKPASMDRFRGKNVGIIFHKSHLIRSLTVKENLLLTQRLGQKRRDINRIDKVLRQLDITTLKSRKVHQISQGQAQRVSVARAVLNNPKLLLADEPTASLDDVNCRLVIELLKSQAELHGSSLIIATHDRRVKDEFKNQLAL